MGSINYLLLFEAYRGSETAYSGFTVCDSPVNPSVEVFPGQANSLSPGFVSGSGSHVDPGSAPVSDSLVLGSYYSVKGVGISGDSVSLLAKSVSTPVPALSSGLVNRIEASPFVPG